MGSEQFQAFLKLLNDVVYNSVLRFRWFDWRVTDARPLMKAPLANVAYHYRFPKNFVFLY